MIKTDSVFYEACKYTYHAEQSCIMKCPNKNILKNCTLILVRLVKNTNTNTDTNISIAKPCPMCAHIINKYKIRRVICITSL